MFWPILITYVIISEILVLTWIWWSVLNCSEFADQFDFSNLTQAQKMRVYVVLTIFILLAAPIALPVMLYYLLQCAKEVYVENQNLFRLYMEMSLDPLHRLNVPSELQQHIDEHTPAAVAMNFTELGDYWLKGDPFNSKARIFMGPNSDTFCEIGITLETYYYELTTFLENGTMISSANCDASKFVKKFRSKGYHVNAHPDAELLELIESHRNFTEGVTAETGQLIRVMEQARWKDYFHYHNRKYGTVRFELGEIDAPPEKCEFPKKCEFPSKGFPSDPATENQPNATTQAASQAT